MAGVVGGGGAGEASPSSDLGIVGNLFAVLIPMGWEIRPEGGRDHSDRSSDPILTLGHDRRRSTDGRALLQAAVLLAVACRPLARSHLASRTNEGPARSAPSTVKVELPRGARSALLWCRRSGSPEGCETCFQTFTRRSHECGEGGAGSSELPSDRGFSEATSQRRCPGGRRSAQRVPQEHPMAVAAGAERGLSVILAEHPGPEAGGDPHPRIRPSSSARIGGAGPPSGCIAPSCLGGLQSQTAPRAREPDREKWCS